MLKTLFPRIYLEYPMNWNLAELNIAKMKFEPESPEMQDFNDAIDSVNTLADASPGFFHHPPPDIGTRVKTHPGYPGIR